MSIIDSSKFWLFYLPEKNNRKFDILQLVFLGSQILLNILKL